MDGEPANLSEGPGNALSLDHRFWIASGIFPKLRHHRCRLTASEIKESGVAGTGVPGSDGSWVSPSVFAAELVALVGVSGGPISWWNTSEFHSFMWQTFRF